MIAFLLKLLPFKQWMIIGLIVSLVGGFAGGWKVADWKNKGELLRMMEAAEELRIENEEWNAELERRYLEATQELRVITRDIVKEIPVHIPAGQCFDPAGVRFINDSIKRQSE